MHIGKQLTTTTEVETPPSIGTEFSLSFFIILGLIASIFLLPIVGLSIPEIKKESKCEGDSCVNEDFNRRCEQLNPSNQKQYFVVSVLLQGINEDSTSIEEIKNMRESFNQLDENIKVTWSMTNDFVFLESHRPQLELVKSYVDEFGDEVGVAYGFPNNNETEESWEIIMDEWMKMYLYNAFNDTFETLTDETDYYSFIPEVYRPTSVSSYLINPLQAKHMQEKYEIRSFMGTTATQYNVDQLSALGSPLMPYYANDKNTLVPDQGEDMSEKMFFINTLSIDPIGSRYTSGESRWTIHPADPLTDGTSQIYTINSYLLDPYRDKNTVNYISILLEPNWVLRNDVIKKSWENIVEYYKDKNLFEITGIKEFNEIYDCLLYKDDYNPEFSLYFTGSGLSKAGFTSDRNLSYFWTETKSERIILERKGELLQWRIIDFTDYSGDIPELPFTTNAEDVSFITGRNFKISSDKPVTQDDLDRIKQRLEEVGFWEEVVYE